MEFLGLIKGIPIVKRWIENKLFYFYYYKVIPINVETSSALFEELSAIAIPSSRYDNRIKYSINCGYNDKFVKLLFIYNI